MNIRKQAHTTLHYLIVFFLFLIFMIFCFSATQNIHVHAASKKGTVNTEGLNVRTKASTDSDVVISLDKDQKVTITGSKTNKKGEIWYKIKVNIKKISYTGYAYSIYINTTSSKKAAPTANTTVQPQKTAFVSRFGKLKKKGCLYLTPSKKKGISCYLKKGTLIRVKSKTKKGKTTWYYVRTYGLKRTYYGYSSSSYIQYEPTTIKSTRYKVAVVKSKGGVYKTANGSDAKLGTLKAGKDCIIRGTLTVGGKKWSKVKTSFGTGYVLSSHLTPVTSTVKNSTNYTGTVTKRSCARKVASLLASNNGTAQNGTSVTVLGQLTVNRILWYKCQFTLNQTVITGYIRAKYVTLDTEGIFQTCLSTFPESYRPYLQALHATHPAWQFQAVDTKLNWTNVISNEAVAGKNTIQSNCPKGGAASEYSAPFSYLSTESGDYNWATDTYTLRDGSNWYSANAAVVSYYMDPRNFLTETGIFQFESLSLESIHNQSVVETMLKNTFMAQNYNVTDISTKQQVSGSYASAFMDAASASQVSPYYLVSRVINEVGTSGSGSTSGTYKGYAGYYNFYNIGANDSASGQAVANGLAWAKKGTTFDRPWTTPYKSIVGGSKYIAQQYIGIGQNTVYTQKFNVVVPSSYFIHQYMTNVQAANSYALSNYNTYKNNGLLDNAYVFYIPVYDSMPDTPCALPAATGNPNNYVGSLSVKKAGSNTNISLNQTFNYATKNYTAAVAASVTSVNVAASAISKYASISGTGNYKLSKGNNTIKVICTAQNGTTSTYTITITRN